MIADRTQLVKETYALLKTAIDANANAAIGVTPVMRWDTNEEAAKPGPDKFWIRASVHFLTQEQHGLCSNVSGPGLKRFENSALLMLEVYGPRTVYNGKQLCLKLAEVAQKPYLGTDTDSGIWFRNTRIVSVPIQNDWHRLNVISEIEFDLIG